jgi:galactokinase
MSLPKSQQQGFAMLSDDRIHRLRQAFRERAGRDPSGVWAAPGRVNLVGEHTDYNDGLVLPFAIDREAIAAVALREDGQLRCWSLQNEPDGWQAYHRGVFKALVHDGIADRGGDVVIDSDVPIGSGLSSSAALECALALALSDLSHANLDRMTLALACQRAENDEVGAQTGIMDQVASLFGAAGSLMYLDVSDRTVTAVDADFDGLALLVIDTRARHSNADGGYADRRRECAAAAALLGLSSLRGAGLEQVAGLAKRPGHEGLLGRRARHVYTENARVTRAVSLLQTGRAHDLGPVLTASHISLRDDFEVSAPELDVAVDVALDAGALGARLTGGGFGGSALVLCRADNQFEVRRGVQQAYARRDWPEPEIFAVTPAEGARRLR